MNNSIKQWTYSNIAARLKSQMCDIIDVAYQDRTPGMRGQLKRFTIQCSEVDMRTKLGDCRWNANDKTSRIRIHALGSEGFREILITTMHEVSHHIDFSIRGSSGHDKPFYIAHKKLLFAAMDMGIITKDDVIHSASHAQNRNKLAGMMSEYVPQPVQYKQKKVLVCAYNAFSVKDDLKRRGYTWNSVDETWTKEIDIKDLHSEKAELTQLGLADTDIRTVHGGAVVVRLRKNVRLYNVPFESNVIVKKHGFKWVINGKQKYWEKKIDGEALPDDTLIELKSIPGIKIKIQ